MSESQFALDSRVALRETAGYRRSTEEILRERELVEARRRRRVEAARRVRGARDE